MFGYGVGSFGRQFNIVNSGIIYYNRNRTPAAPPIKEQPTITSERIKIKH